MIVETDFRAHWKTRMLIDELADPAAPLCLISLWAHCQQRRTDTFDDLSPEALKAICHWAGDAATLQSALAKCRWIDVRGDGIFVRGWADANAKLIANWTNGPKGGRPRKKPRPADAPPSESVPISIGQALSQAHTSGIPEDFARWVYDDWISRKCRDAANVQTDYILYAKKRWNREQVEWRDGKHHSQQKNAAGGPIRREPSERAKSLKPSDQ